MRTLKNRISNINKIHSHACIQYHFKSGFTFQQQFNPNLLNLTHIPHQTATHHTIEYSTARTEKPQHTPHQQPPENSQAKLG